MKKLYYCWNESILNNKIHGFAIGDRLKALIQFKNESLSNRINYMINNDIPDNIVCLEQPLCFIEVTIDNNNIITSVNVFDNNLIKKLIAIHE